MSRIFTYEEALQVLPDVQRLTESAVELVQTLLPEGVDEADDLPQHAGAEYQRIVSEWSQSVMELGAEVKGLWLVDFDSGSGYYCWRYPEPSLQYFHGYEEGFGGRVKLN